MLTKLITRLLFTALPTLLLFACNSQEKTSAPVAKEYKHPCGCRLTEKEMITKCPVDAMDDSVLICKVGTNNVIGSGRPPMTWPEYIASEYFGGEGELVDCKTGKPLLTGVKSPIISYKNKQLLVDNRFAFDVYDAKTGEWKNIEIPVWRKRIFAINNELNIAADSFIFKPPFHGAPAFAKVAKEYETEVKRTDHYLITNTVNRLLVCSLCGDKLSEQRLLTIRNDFADYYNDHPDSDSLLNERLAIYQAYKSYLDAGGKREYFDLSGFINFKK